MVATVADVLSLAEAKRQLGVQAAVTDFDEVIQDAINQAVSWVGRLVSVPLVNEDRTYELTGASGTDAATILMPLSWPQPLALRHFDYTNTAMSAAPQRVLVTGTPVAFRGTPSEDWKVLPAMFGLTDGWPSHDAAEITVSVGMESIPERIVAAVVIACRSFYRAQEPPRQTIQDIIG